MALVAASGQLPKLPPTITANTRRREQESYPSNDVLWPCCNLREATLRLFVRAARSFKLTYTAILDRHFAP